MFSLRIVSSLDNYRLRAFLQSFILENKKVNFSVKFSGQSATTIKNMFLIFPFSLFLLCVLLKKNKKKKNTPQTIQCSDIAVPTSHHESHCKSRHQICIKSECLFEFLSFSFFSF